MGNLIIFFAALFAIIQRNYHDELNLRINPGLVGLSISYALQITQSLNYVVRMASELETNIVAVERIKEYSETPTEAPPIVESNRPPDDWPSQGHVKFDHYSTRYREGLDLVLKDITVDIPGGTKVPIISVFIQCSYNFIARYIKNSFKKKRGSDIQLSYLVLSIFLVCSVGRFCMLMIVWYMHDNYVCTRCIFKKI